MVVEPSIDWKSFFADVEKGMSAYNLQDKYLLSPRQYRRIMRNVTRKKWDNKTRSRIKPYTKRSNFQEPYVTLKKDGYYIIRKNKIYYGQYSTLEIAREIKKKLIECNWDKNQLNKIREEFDLEPLRRYNL